MECRRIVVLCSECPCEIQEFTASKPQLLSDGMEVAAVTSVTTQHHLDEPEARGAAGDRSVL